MTLKELSKETEVHSKLVKVIQVHECPYCKRRYDKVKDAETCLDSHNLIFEVYKTQMKYDEESGTVIDDLVFWKSFDKYKGVKEFEGVYPYKMVIKER